MLPQAQTMHGFLGTPDGAVCGFAPNTPGGMPPWRTPDPGTSIDGLWLASAYAGMGGFNGAIAGGAAASRAALTELHP